MKTLTLSIAVCALLMQGSFAKADCALGSYVSVIQQGSNSHIGSPSAQMGCQNMTKTARNNIDPTNPNNAQRDVSGKLYDAPSPPVTVTTPAVAVTTPMQPGVVTMPTQPSIVTLPTQPVVIAQPTPPVVSVQPVTPPVAPPSPPDVVIQPMQPTITPPTHPTHVVTLPEPAIIDAPVGLSGIPVNNDNKDKGDAGKQPNSENK